jgi:hypothetical protein
VLFDKEASQTRDCTMARKTGMIRAARPDLLRFRSGQALATQERLARDDNATARLPEYPQFHSAKNFGIIDRAPILHEIPNTI